MVEDYQREVKLVSVFYRGDIHEANLQCQLRQFATIFEYDGKKEEAVLSDVLLYMRGMTNRERLTIRGCKSVEACFGDAGSQFHQ